MLLRALSIFLYPFTGEEKCLKLAKAEVYEQIMGEFEKRNAQLQNGEWKKGWRAFCEKASNLYMKSSNRENNPDLFAHFLDCEAHTDVWRELFPTWNLTNEK